jgi:alpha-glucosidase
MAGVKIDFMDSSAKKVVEFYTSALAEAAALGLMVNFHGAYEPTGESRTWPNEMTREGILGLEYSIWSTIPLDHYASLPFTRLLAGHGDFTPCTFTPSRLKGTTCALQLATAVVYTSPVMHWADKPRVYVGSPALEVIKRIPSVWDETRVLDGSAIGEFAAFARRRGHDWFVGVINAGAARVFELKPAFLGTGYYFAQFHGDKPGEPEAITWKQTVATAGQTIPIEIQKGGGFVACFSKLRMVPHGGVFARTQRIRVEAAGRATDIRYTLDGSEPTEASPKYGKRIDLEKSAVVRVKVLGGDGAGAELKARFIKR